MRDRAYRRHQAERAKARTVPRLVIWGHTEITPELIARYSVDRTPCSCWACGNPRRYFGEVTRQELLAGIEGLTFP